MGILNPFSKKPRTPMVLPSGAITMDKTGQIVSSTVSSAFPKEMVLQVGQNVLLTFQQAQKAQLALTEINFLFGSLKIKARELRGGAIIFFSPREHETKESIYPRSYE